MLIIVVRPFNVFGPGQVLRFTPSDSSRFTFDGMTS